jgi:hypothetical protein
LEEEIIMGKTICAGFALFVLGLASLFCSAQDCSESFSTMSFHCDGPDGCSDGVTVWYPNNPDQYGAPIDCGSVSCCGQLFSNCPPGQGGCEPEILKKPGAKAEIARLAVTSEVLIADCVGRYVEYKPVPVANLNRRKLALIDEHVLR